MRLERREGSVLRFVLEGSPQPAEEAGERPLLMVRRYADGNVVVLALSGRIVSEHVGELEAMLRIEPEGRSTVLDLQDVVLVHRDVVSFLARCEARGTRLRNCPPYVREWVDAASREIARPREISREAGRPGRVR